jgi:hypothetical protein
MTSQDEQPAFAGREQATGRFRKGHSGNPKGMKPGYRRKATAAAERILLADVASIAQTVVDMAKAGQPWACAAILRLVLPPARERLVPFTLPPIATPADLPGAVQSLLQAAADGQLTLGEAERIAGMLDTLRCAFEARDFAKEIEALKDEMADLRGHEPRNANGHRALLS